MSFRLVPKSVTLNGVTALIMVALCNRADHYIFILYYFTEFGIASAAHCIKVIEDIPKLSAT